MHVGSRWTDWALGSEGEQVGSEMLLVRRYLDLEANCPLTGVTVKEYLQNQTNLALGRLING